MQSKNVVVSGVGCSLVDRLYSNISFDNESFKSLISKENGDGGLTPGHLVFKEEFEKFGGKKLSELLNVIIAKGGPNKVNIGGPGIVSLIHAAQMSHDNDCQYYFFGCRGDDGNGKLITSLLSKTPVLLGNYKITKEETPSTVVLSDPDFDNGHGERIFINSVGAAMNYAAEDLNDTFFSSDVVVFGGTALLPSIHDNLTELLAKSKSKGCITIVNTVYDFRNEKLNPHLKWPLGKDDASYQNIDLLLMDHEEALRLSGKRNISKAISFFKENGVGALIVTCGAENVRLYSDGSLFEQLPDAEMPISRAVYDKLQLEHNGDTTGCGDNFVGGVIASLVEQFQSNKGIYDLTEACMWGVVSGGTTCFYIGGMFEESQSGEKKGMIEPYLKLYKEQIMASK